MSVLRPELDWQWHLVRQLDELGPTVRPRYLPDPAGLAQVSGSRLLDAEFLRAAIMRARPAEPTTGDGSRDDDPRIGVSRMSRLYCAALNCVALAGLANGVGIDLSPGRYSVTFDNNVPSRVSIGPEYEGREVLRCAERPTSWPVSGPVVATLDELREYVYTNLYAHNLGLLFTAATRMVNVPERLLWTNAAEWVAVLMDAAIEYLDPSSAAPFVADCQALLAADSLPGTAGHNPLRGLVEWLPYDGGEPAHGIQTRHLCCMLYQHSDRHGRLCQNCPLLPLPDRAALVRERRGTGMVGSGGPAEQRCVEVGRDRIARATRKRSRGYTV
ncbi:IucA/IucC family C-terminal-domain containing protein [Actinophytocola sp.]|uniref:IucA/IucC family C-terminal-domain containing protein n=1 Tax=Actinophytocola sp. TaxID=1872138 RepID=UPI002ED15394